MAAKIDIHGYKKKLESAFLYLKKHKSISENNKKLIISFVDEQTARGISNPRLIKYIEILRSSAKGIKKDYDKCTKEDLMTFIGDIQRKDYSPWTKQMYKVILKMFFKWLRNTEEYPDEVKWISTGIPRNQLKLPSEGDLLTEKEISKLIDTAEHPRDKAFISMLYESGCRISELASLTVGLVAPDKYGVQFAVQGKTGSRKLRIISSTQYLMNWINMHPLRNDKNAPMWISIGTRNRGKALNYDAIRKMLRVLFEKANINKRCNPHIFRHSRASHMANHLTEFQMNTYFGWIQGSKMPSTYVHLSGREMDKALLRMNGIFVSEQEKEDVLKPRVCPRCDTINTHDATYCSKCAGVVDPKEAMRLQEKERKMEEEFEAIRKLLRMDGVREAIEKIRQ